MAEYTIDKFSYGGNTYILQDSNVGIDSTYDEATDTVILTVGSLSDADTTQY